MSEILTSFGKFLLRSYDQRTPIDASSLRLENWKDLYADSIKERLEFQSRLKSSRITDSVLIVGPGADSSGIQEAINLSDSLPTVGTQWTNYIPDLNLDYVASSHYSPLAATNIYTDSSPHLIHFVYSKVPPLLANSTTIRWYDIYVNQSDLTQSLRHPSNYADYLAANFSAHLISPILPSARNTLFLILSYVLALGAKRVVLANIDPVNPDYFFSSSTVLKNQIIKDLSNSSPVLSSWDGRNERIPKIPVATQHRLLECISNIANSHPTGHGVTTFLDEYRRAFALLQGCMHSLGVDLSYIGTSDFLSEMSVKKE